MGLFSLISTFGTAFFGFAHPAYATWKVIAGRPATEPELEGWMFYWVVVGLFVAAERLFDWLINWFPLYCELKFLFILWLVSPGTQGSTYLYKSYVQPFFASNTQNIDRAILSAHTNAIAFVQSSLQAAWAFIVSRLTTAQNQAVQNQGPAPGQAGNPAQNGPLQAMAGLFTQFGPSVIAAATSMLSPTQNRNAAQQAIDQQSFPNPNPGPNPNPSPQSPPSSTAVPTPTDQLRYRGVPDESRRTPPPAFPIPQHQT